MQNTSLPRALDTLKEELVQRLRGVAALRASLAAAKDPLVEKKKAFEAEIAPVVAEVKKIESQVSIAEREARALVIDHYREDPDKNKKPVAGTGIRLSTTVAFDEDKALAWAKQKGMFLIPVSLDRAALETFLLNHKGPLDLEFSVGESIDVTLAKDLDAVLPVVAASTEAPEAGVTQ